MVVRSFSSAGGLELYAHKLIEGLLSKGLRITVICEESASDFRHKNLSLVEMGSQPGRQPKWQRLQNHFIAASRATAESGPFDLVHSQHFPVSGADLVTFHNHTVNRLSRVGFAWERTLNSLKARLVRAYRLRQEYDELLCRNAHCLIFPSRVMHDDFYESYPFLEKRATPYIVAHPGADLSVPVPSPSSAAGGIRETSAIAAAPTAPLASFQSGEPFSFLFVGRGYRKKGLDVLFDACRHLASAGSDFKLLIAGLEKKPVDTLRLKARGIEGKVEFLGFRKDMAAVYARAQVIVSPSRLEPFGMAPLQAMKQGLTPVVSAVSGVAEVLSDGVDCLVLDDHLDARGLARLMQKLMDEPDLRARLSKAALETARQVTWQQTVEATLSAYEIALAAKRDAPLSALK